MISSSNAGPVRPTAEAIERAVALLRAGRLVAFPTETVYGLGADASDPVAVGHIFAAKGRPSDHPLIVHMPDAGHVEYWARDIPPAAWTLIERFWPGPLTLILKRGQVPLEVTGGQDSVALRMPDHPIARALLTAFGGGLAAPSANRFGRVSPTRAEHVFEELGERVDMILDGGPCRVGVESTILSLAGAEPVLLRPGRIGAAALAEVLGRPVIELPRAAPADIRAPGMLESHYAPGTPLELVPGEAIAPRALALAEEGSRVAVLTRAFQESLAEVSDRIVQVAMPAGADDYAHSLYASLRRLDGEGFDRLLVQAPPDVPEWRAVLDRLRRASRGG